MKTPILKLFSSYRHWTKGVHARFKYISLARAADSCACSVGADNEIACCWCLSGAVTRCYPCDQRDDVFRKLRKSIADLFSHRFSDDSVIAFNDDPRTTFADVLRVVRRAKV